MKSRILLSLVSAFVVLSASAQTIAVGRYRTTETVEEAFLANLRTIPISEFTVKSSDKTQGTIQAVRMGGGHEFASLFVLITKDAEGVLIEATFTRNRSFIGGGQPADWAKKYGEQLRSALPDLASADKLSASSCGNNFEVKGSIVRGTTYSAFEEFAATDQAAAVEALTTAISRQSLTLGSVDKSSGTISATGQADGGKPFELDFAVVPILGGVRLSVSRKLHPGVHGSDDAVRDQLCKVISEARKLTPKPAMVIATPRPIAAPTDSTSIEDRLRKLDELYKKGLITEDEYKKKRAELLSRL